MDGSGTFGQWATAFTMTSGGLSALWTVYLYKQSKRKDRQQELADITTKQAADHAADLAREHRFTELECGLERVQTTLEDLVDRIGRMESK